MMTVLTAGSRSLPAAVKMLTVKKTTALMPDNCWLNMRPTATSTGLAADQRNISVNLAFCSFGTFAVTISWDSSLSTS